MTKGEFIARAVKALERDQRLPTGWWGKYRDFTDGRHRVLFSGGAWSLRVGGKLVSRHDSRTVAIRKARSL